jgi:predicted RNA binding protein YcfA (HicA-like mRNA interferase family)
MPMRLDQKSARRLLESHGWTALPRHRGTTYGAGLTRAILRQAGLN